MLFGGASADARRSLAELRNHHPELTIADVRECQPPLPRDYSERVVDALHTVGLPLLSNQNSPQRKDWLTGRRPRHGGRRPAIHVSSAGSHEPTRLLW